MRSRHPAYQVAPTVTTTSSGTAARPTADVTPSCAAGAPMTRSVIASAHCWMLSAWAPGTNWPTRDSQTSAFNSPTTTAFRVRTASSTNSAQ
ncbi:hypothetical protein [Geodermatophilus sp. CPCC 205761]|uniref:hypothetical protein n=2 Tax=unclassified Geodermatophilus TaxID=2637632 RepID=UPI003EE90F82